MMPNNQHVFSKNIEDLGCISIRSFDLNQDMKMLHSWVTKPYAKYWGMLDKTLDEVKLAYEEIQNSTHHHAFVGVLNDKVIFLIEQYKASEDLIARYYDSKANDYGMHVLVAPVENRIPNFTWHIFTTILDYFFSLPFVERIIVEPDVNNDKIHVLNKKAGFVYQKEIQLPHKRAALAICTKATYQNSLKALQ